ncbi:MAG: DUF4856 domain-containing protein [Bacteroidota bacterium]
MIRQIFQTIIILLGTILFMSCNRESMDPVEAPATYSFERDGASTVSFSGQTTRIKMATELAGSLKSFDTATEADLLEKYRNQTADGNDANPYTDADLNASDKSVKSKVAASRDYFSSNTAIASQIKEDFETWISAQITEVFPAENEIATAGNPGQLADGSTARYVNAQGLEYDQMIVKGLIGALMTDQALNNYLSPSVLDEGSNITDNDEGTVVDGKSYTNMEHKWDEAYGYLYGTSQDATEPNATIGADDAFLNKYIGRVEGDDDFAGIAATIYDAFKLGRAAIVAGDYELRDQQAAIIQEEISKVIAIRAVYYLQQGKNALANSDFGGAFHDFSEGYGFIYSLQFTRRPNTNDPYFTKAQVDAIITKLLGDGENGLWDVTAATLDELSNEIAAEFTFTVEQAGS